ncbi:iron-containing alcohol dehydrogenase [Synergistes jonesii]|uniref:Butanol dehydrogenase n=1 Tax=Synergistes jonesii TaxID=2754 RepID=A0A073IPC7_9BACT|nr:iron-containing alcohol dehydrogenase [Synergistes jonesii]KEJ91420.1 butanol dehydrogenase [Synergistes jonesii]OFB60481.1 butanol dehydrogenase [Synergistes jonesii]OFB61491.1 butanol dehydrogenase [Synergistes jonesii]OFB64461.1 butanol dehydrogenase [Synergistes jonesii]OFB66783.1 butanol dehydrogenase [Synergistes jonesii]
MLGNFSYCNPTKLYFGDDSLKFLGNELKKYGDNVLLVYGGGSIKRNGIYEDVIEILRAAGKNVAELPGVMPNPTLQKLYEGIEAARKQRTDMILAVGGGSVCDYAKALSVSVNCSEDPWDKYFIRFEEPECETLPVGCVLTMAGTGSEMNAGAVITNPEKKLKIGHVFADEKIMPRFSILNPKYTLTLPKYQMVAGVYDIFNHICEQYFSGDDDNTSDYISEGLMRSLLHSSRKAVKDPLNYEARSNLMWTATWALNTLVAKGKSCDWMIHMLGQSVGAMTNATHGMTLAAVSLQYYRHILTYALPKFARFAANVWDVCVNGKTEEEIAREGLAAMEGWMKHLGLVMNITELGATKEMIPDLVKGTLILKGGYKVLDESEVAEIFRRSL